MSDILNIKSAAEVACEHLEGATSLLEKAVLDGNDLALVAIAQAVIGVGYAVLDGNNL